VEKSPIVLRGPGGEISAELWDEISDAHIDLWTSSWVPEIEAAKKRFGTQGVPEEKRPQDLHWKWDEFVRKTRPYLTYRRFSILAENKLQGLMLANLSSTARIESQKGKDLVYADLISTAPWNRKDAVNTASIPRFSGIGVIMVRVAIELSIAEGFKGRIGLHSLGQAETFYRDRCKMTDLGLDRVKRMVYFEMTEEQAVAFASEA
jgi:hypothetical protein